MHLCTISAITFVLVFITSLVHGRSLDNDIFFHLFLGVDLPIRQTRFLSKSIVAMSRRVQNILDVICFVYCDSH